MVTVLRWLSVCLACLPSWVGAHAHLLHAEPPANAVIGQSPQQLRLKFSEPIEKKFVRIKVIANAQPLPVNAENIQWDAATLTLLVNLPTHVANNYEVQWSVLAKDGHASRGQFVFKVKTP